MKREKLSKAAASGAVALIFLVLGFQAAIFTGNVFRYNREHRVDTVYVVSPGSGSEKTRLEALSPGESGVEKLRVGNRGSMSSLARSEGFSEPKPGEKGTRHQAVAEGGGEYAGGQVFDIQGYMQNRSYGERGSDCVEMADNQQDILQGAIAEGGNRSVVAKGLAPRQEPGYSDSRRAIAEKFSKKPEPETFEFDPNTVSREDLVRLGFSEKQAQVIENYRSKGGKYYSPADFAKMYVVDSAAYARLKPYIKIRKLDLNTADSLELIGLRGIGPYYAHKIIEYRRRLGGVFTSKQQLLEIDGFDADRLEGFSKGVEVRAKTPWFTIWSATKDQLKNHPYIGPYTAKGIIRYKSVADTAFWTLVKLVENGVLTEDAAARLKYLDGSGESGHE